MKYLLPILALNLLLFCGLSQAEESHAQKVAPYLLPSAPTFDLTITQFRNLFNSNNPSLALSEFRAINAENNKESLTRAATAIDDQLYASAALERGTLKIKSLQLTWLTPLAPEQKLAQAKAMDYMTAMIRCFSPLLSKEQSLQKLNKLLSDSKNRRYFSQNDGALRYVIANNGQQGLTFAIEPIKLTLSDS